MMIQVQLATARPSLQKHEPSQRLSFSLEGHVHLDSWWNAALQVLSVVPPALHYKFLAVLLTNLFLRTFDLGVIIDEASDPIATAPYYVDNTVPILQQQQTTKRWLVERQNDRLPTTEVGCRIRYTKKERIKEKHLDRSSLF
jgi:hypothetical protein